MVGVVTATGCGVPTVGTAAAGCCVVVVVGGIPRGIEGGAVGVVTITGGTTGGGVAVLPGTVGVFHAAGAGVVEVGAPGTTGAATG